MTRRNHMEALEVKVVIAALDLAPNSYPALSWLWRLFKRLLAFDAVAMGALSSVKTWWHGSKNEDISFYSAYTPLTKYSYRL